ncbi:cell wall-binding repeat-containing protein [Anaerobacillus isosaccharinicus]|uniref:ArsR family transcriptional regulator n=1 Tax=Anaerobacillus isosaccharinicus TaxID=1532552 RepID=A0A1S2KXR4_9BACI|nr:ArsR family transcriptional regulator [Anaerobacillus isosaccharinicus]MBA5584763.1 cell wall-binding repeat-containing protein [Anaerobacillus isosaccharinicus]QOY38484.1 cell wall-binding repeat-containing protein [Anaerobacillus isosaccharinicus]
MKGILVLFLLIFTVSIIGGCSNDDTQDSDSDSDPGQEKIGVTEGNETKNVSIGGLLHLNTKNVTRLNSNDPFEVSVLTSQTIWPATHNANQPGTIMLAPLEEWQLSLASLNLVHHPNDGPLLFTSEGIIPDLILNEIKRLNPKGNISGTQIMVLGKLNEGELDKLNDFEVLTIAEENPAAFANEIDEFYSNLINEVPESVIIGSLDEKAKEFTIIAGSWITHMNESLLYVSETEIPAETISALEKRAGNASIYVVGPESVISNEVLNQLGQYGEVTRISGETPAQMAIEFAKFRDPKTNFGWGITSPGHGIVMVSTTIPELAITSAPFAHLGKHAPMVWLEDGKFNEEMHEYLAMLKPMFDKEPTEGPYNHGYLIGNEALVSYRVQGIIDEMLEIVPSDGGGHGDHSGH